MKEIKIVVVRHGQTEMNIHKVMSGWTDIKLSLEGIDDLKLKKKYINYPVTDRYYTSALRRSKDTFDILYGQQHTIDGSYEAFNEINFGDVEHKKIADVSEIFHEHFLNEISYLGAETFTQFKDRVMNKLIELCQKLLNDEESSLTIVCHSGTTRMINHVLNGIEHQRYYENKIGNGEGYIFTCLFDGDHLTLEHSEVLTLPQDKQ